MIAMTLTVCSILADGGKCKDVELTFFDVPLIVCVMSGLPEVARWSAANPNWIVKRWTCGDAGRIAKI